MPANVANADIAFLTNSPSGLLSRWIERHGKRVRTVENLNHLPVKRPDLTQKTIREEIGIELHVPYVDFTVRRTRVNVLPSRCFRRTEVTPNESS